MTLLSESMFWRVTSLIKLYLIPVIAAQNVESHTIDFIRRHVDMNATSNSELERKNAALNADGK